jgi:antitoxin HicB
MINLAYRVVIEPLSAEDGGGFLATAPDLPGCTSDGDTAEDALRNVAQAIDEWIEHAASLGWPIPAPVRAHAA